MWDYYHYCCCCCYHLNMRNGRTWIEQRNFYYQKFLLTHDIAKDLPASLKERERERDPVHSWGGQFLDFNCILIVMSLTYIGKCLNKLKLDLHSSSPQGTTLALCFVMTIVLISFFAFLFSLHLACDYS